jgi:hypothetical protein
VVGLFILKNLMYVSGHEMKYRKDALTTSNNHHTINRQQISFGAYVAILGRGNTMIA